jgi:hypothetical protein
MSTHDTAEAAGLRTELRRAFTFADLDERRPFLVTTAQVAYDNDRDQDFIIIAVRGTPPSAVLVVDQAHERAHAIVGGHARTFAAARGGEVRARRWAAVARFLGSLNVAAPASGGEALRREVAYRRGAHQAVVAMLERLRGGATVEDLARFERVMRSWRAEAHLATGTSADGIPGWAGVPERRQA